MDVRKRNHPILRSASDVSLDTAMEIARVGIVPSSLLRPVGYIELIAGQPFTITGYATRDEFLQAVADADLEDQESFRSVSSDMYFLRVSTD